MRRGLPKVRSTTGFPDFWGVLMEFEFHKSVGAERSGKSSFSVAATNATAARSLLVLVLENAVSNLN